MTQENAEKFLHLLNTILSTPDDDERVEATDMLQQFLKNEGSLFDLFYILQEYQDDNSRSKACLFIHNYFCDLICDYSTEQINQIKDMIISIIQNEPDFQIRKSLCDVIYILMSDTRLTIQCENIYEFANQMLDDENLFTTGMNLWTLILNKLDDESKAQAYDFLIEVCQKALILNDPDSLICGTKLLQVIFENTKNDYSKIADSIVELLLQVLKKVFYEDRNSEEADSIVKNISDLLPYETFEASAIKFAQLALEIMAQDELPLDLRLKAYGLIEGNTDCGCIALLSEDTDVLNSIDFKPIQSYFTLFINLMIQFLQNQRDGSPFDFASKFFHNAGATIEEGKVFNFIAQASAELAMNLDVIGVQVGLFLLYSIVESQQEFFSEYSNMDYVTNYIINYADCEDDYVLTYAFYLLREMAEFVAPALTLKLDSIVAFLMKHINHQDGFQTLDYVLDLALAPPSDLIEFIQTLISIMQQANSEQAVLPLNCIASSISSAKTPNEDVYDLIIPILTEALGEDNENLQKVSIRCFGNLSIIAPRSSAADIDKIAEMLMHAFTGANYSTDIALLIEVINCLKKICENLPISFEPYFDDFAQTIIRILDEAYPIKKGENEGENHTENLNEGDEIYDIQAGLLLCISTFISTYPQKMEQYIKGFFQLLNDNKADQLTIPVCQSIRIAAKEFKAQELDCFTIFNSYLSLLLISDHKEIISEIHITLLTLLKYCREEAFLDHRSKVICERLSCGIGGQYTEYLMYPLSSSPDIILIRPIFNCILQFIDMMGEYIINYIEEISIAVENLLTSQCKLISGLTLEVYAKLSSIFKDDEKFFKTAFMCIFKNMETDKIEIHESIARSLLYLLSSNLELIATNQQLFINYSENVLKLSLSEQCNSDILKYSIIAFWCSLIVALELTPGEEPLALVLSALPPPPSDESIPYIANFISFAMRNFPSAEIQEKLPYIAASAIASDDLIISKIDQTVINEMLEVLSSIQEQDLPQFVFYNEKTHLNLMRNLPKNPEEPKEEEQGQEQA